MWIQLLARAFYGHNVLFLGRFARVVEGGVHVRIAFGCVGRLHKLLHRWIVCGLDWTGLDPVMFPCILVSDSFMVVW
jgi:hypothetical protein